ncbi:MULTISPECIES: hypothetical protein [unclassified Rathayibacter]|uniref:hypothetical protein n=1 Tax=unclassified Rathayibacter TaxID=2609250 RepID=UPI0006F714CF|nr:MULTISPECIES: hypothetical protein [unclassified Rathayibacter]KQQ05137.1 hypothetical protein ASF42_00475 [Rathayibacter sp. Leaf294]KQS13000.1 hypothetical protein ASG06_00475 [Rathayibacter sp. Leaf185]
MKSPKAFRIAARLVAGLGLLVAAVLYLVAAPGVDSAEGALLGGGVVVSQGAIMRTLAVLDIAAGLWVLLRPRSYPGLTAAVVAVISLWLAPRLSDPALVDLGVVPIDVRFVTHPLEVSVVIAGLAVAAFWMSRNLTNRARAGRRG